MKRLRHAFTFLETVVALGIAGLVIVGAMAGVRFFADPTHRAEVTLGELAELSRGAETLDRELRQARQIIYPEPGKPASRVIYYRDFDGFVFAFYYDSAHRQLRRARFSLSGPVTQPDRPPASELEGATFSVNDDGLVSWALFAPSRLLMGSVRRINQ